MAKNKNFFYLWLGQGVSELGNWISFIALNAYIYQTFNSGKILGLFMVLRLVPALAFGTLGGILADRFKPKTIMMLADGCRALLVLAFMAVKDLPGFLLIGFLLSMLDKFFLAAYGTMLPQLVSREELAVANSWRRSASAVITILGPACAGVLLGAYGYRMVFILDACSFMISVLSLILVRPGLPADSAQARQLQFSWLQELQATFKFIAGHTLIFYLSLLRFIDALGSGTFNTALPVFARKFSVGARWSEFGGGYGFLVAAWGLGGLLGSVAVAWLCRKPGVKPDKLFCGAVALMALGFGAAFHTQGHGLALFLLFMGGIGDGISGVIYLTLLMRDSPEALRGKIFGSLTALMTVGVGTGMFAAGLALDRIPALTHLTNWGSMFILAGALLVSIMLRAKTREPAPGLQP